jgi:hypothetical protein
MKNKTQTDIYTKALELAIEKKQTTDDENNDYYITSEQLRRILGLTNQCI